MDNKRDRKHPKTQGRLPAFCTTCGDVLNNYCFSDAASDVKGVIKNLAKCKSEGRFKGRFCAKLFIAGTDSLYLPSRKARTPKKKIDQLKKAILAEISREDAKRNTSR